MRARAEQLLQNAEAQADQIVSEARDHASRVREESDRELAAASAQRDSISAQLSNVRQMLATLGGGQQRVHPSRVGRRRSYRPCVLGVGRVDGHGAGPADQLGDRQGERPPLRTRRRDQREPVAPVRADVVAEAADRGIRAGPCEQQVGCSLATVTPSRGVRALLGPRNATSVRAGARV